MDVKLYSITDDDRVVNKTLGTAKEYSCTFRDTEEILNPVIRITTEDNLSDYNYAYIERYGRYYFIKPAVGPNNLWTLFYIEPFFVIIDTDYLNNIAFK